MRPIRRNGGPTRPPPGRCRSTPISRPSRPSRRSLAPSSTHRRAQPARDGTTAAPSAASLRAGRKLDLTAQTSRNTQHIKRLGPRRNPPGREPIGGPEGGSRETWCGHLEPLADRPTIIKSALIIFDKIAQLGYKFNRKRRPLPIPSPQAQGCLGRVPLRPSGGRGRDPRAAREGEVGAGKRSGIPHLTPALSARGGGEGDAVRGSTQTFTGASGVRP